MSRTWSFGALALVIAGSAASRLAAEDFDWHARLAPGKTLEIKGVNGSIEARGGGSEAEVHATKTARRSDTQSVEIKVVEHADGVTICAVYPTPEDSRPNECAPGRGGHMNTRNNDVQVNFRVRVPAGVKLAARTVNGEIDASGLGADAEARTVNGSIVLDTAGHGEAQTVNGSVRASLGRADWDGQLEFKTVNGAVELELPAGLSTEVHAKTVNGGIDTDFPLTVRGSFSRRSLTGTIGGGGRQLEIATVNGSIKLKQR